MGVPVEIGEVLAGKYQVERLLGHGGMGVVVAARHRQLGQMVALKFLLPEAVANEEQLNRFVREARNVVRLKSEHVARVLDVGTLDNGAPYIVMEYLEGEDLAASLNRQGALPLSLAVDLVLQACDAVAEAHALGIVHRDLKPQNLFAARRHDGTSLVKVLDFGISKTIAGDDFKATTTQAVIGTPAYMSPEQMRSAKLVDARTDVWALGVILYELVIGQLPWEADSFAALCFRIGMDPPPPLPAALRQNGFEAVLQRCLEKDPAHRFPDVHALACELLPFAPAHSHALVERIGRVLGTSARPSMPNLVAPPRSARVSLGTLREASGQQQVIELVEKPRFRWIAGGIATAVLAGSALTALVMRGGGETSAIKAMSSDAVARPPAVAPPPVVASPPDPIAEQVELLPAEPPDSEAVVVAEPAEPTAQKPEKPRDSRRNESSSPSRAKQVTRSARTEAFELPAVAPVAPVKKRDPLATPD